jgi:glutamate mutase epsilon subunit
MKPTQEQALDWAFECDFVESSPAEDVFSAIYVCCPKDIERLVILAYEAGRKDENEACAQIAFNAKTYIEAAAAIRARREQ